MTLAVKCSAWLAVASLGLLVVVSSVACQSQDAAAVGLMSNSRNLDNLSLEDGVRIMGEAGTLTGASVSGAGDVNGDGIDDVIIGAPSRADKDFPGYAYVIFGKNSGLDHIDLSALPHEDGFRIRGRTGTFGKTVSGINDVNNDGIDDMVIGAPPDALTGAMSDTSYVIFGKSGIRGEIDTSAFSPEDGFRIHPNASETLGRFVSDIGDMDGDDITDFVVAADLSGNESQIYLLYGRNGGTDDIDLSDFSPSMGFRVRNSEAMDNWPVSVSAAGDVNSDGFNDLVIGINLGYGRADPRKVFRNQAVYLIYGRDGGPGDIDLANLPSKSGPVIQGSEHISGVDASRMWGTSVGDVNGDGFDDLAVAQAPEPWVEGANYISTQVVYGSAHISGHLLLSDLSAEEKLVIYSDPVSDDFEYDHHISGAGDVNGDGFDDLVINTERVIYVIHGKLARTIPINLQALDPEDGIKIYHAENDEQWPAIRVSAAGDVNGDGIDDLVIGAPGRAVSEYQGRGYLVFGRKQIP